MKTFAALVAAGVAASASAQTEMIVCVEEVSLGSWNITAELVNPENTLIAAVADLAFTMNGAGIANFSYNSAFDSDFFGPASVTTTPTSVNFSGANTLPPLANAGGPDSSNPLQIATFTAVDLSSFTVNGLLTGAYVGTPFDEVFIYQNLDGSPGTVEYNWCIPAPASVTLLGFAGIAAVRRRR